MNMDVLKIKAEIYVSEYLQHYGIQPNLRGYFFLRTAVLMYIEDDTVLTRIRTGLYPEIAEKYRTTPQRVESSMRNAIESAWKNRISGNKLNDIRGSNEKPSNTEFISSATEKVMGELRNASKK